MSGSIFVACPNCREEMARAVGEIHRLRAEIEALRRSHPSYGDVDNCILPPCHYAPRISRQPLTANDCWEAINALIKPGPLQGDGIDKTAERNGLIFAANVIADMMRKRNARGRAAPQDWCQLQNAPCSTYPFCQCGRVSPPRGT